tara:strand:+ start:635 stop:3268 length:2634 start_codon:yes stop_codon:yes gene_type:complete
MEKSGKKMTSHEIKNLFLKFFIEKGHSHVPSSAIVPRNDKSLLFTNSGMVQFKDEFLGVKQPPNPKVVTCQNCLRAGGKHNDLENVGYTARHHTFFQMLGNFSFGDYFKETAITFAWELLTEVYELDERNLIVTVYDDDEETYRIWRRKIGISDSHILQIGDNKGGKYASDNFWQMAETGPCGPCTEIFFDYGPSVEGGLPGTENEGDRFVEIWNLVFMQFYKDTKGKVSKLPVRCVDTGMGLERISAVLQGVTNNYQIDTFSFLMAGAAKVLKVEEFNSVSLKVISDHIRAIFFLLREGINPGNEGRGYVLRRIIRRAVRYAYKCEIREPFLARMVDVLVKDFTEPINKEEIESIKSKITSEEEKFSMTFFRGMEILSEKIRKTNSDVLSGSTAFLLYDTYGFPIDLTVDICKEKRIKVNIEEFNLFMKEQKERSKDKNQFQRVVKINEPNLQTEFIGYTMPSFHSEILGIFRDDEKIAELKEGERAYLVLEKSCFYAESGGQIGDSGVITSSSGQVSVVDTKKFNRMILHECIVEKGILRSEQSVSGCIDELKRDMVMRNHSATHLLHFALRSVLGDHVVQRGSLVSDEKTRFDFSHDFRLDAQEITAIEQIVNEIIKENHKTEIKNMDYSEAVDYGAIALFGEKYGDRVRVLKIGPSIELCGGTHVSRTGDLGFFKIISEGSVSSGVRRIEAVSGKVAEEYVVSLEKTLRKTSEMLNVPSNKVIERVKQLSDELNLREKEIRFLKSERVETQKISILRKLDGMEEPKILVMIVNAANASDLRDITDEIKSQFKNFAVVLGTVNDGKVFLVSRVSKTLVDEVSAKEVLELSAEKIGGKGGGRVDFAQAGGNMVKNLDLALKQANQYFIHRLKKNL